MYDSGSVVAEHTPRVTSKIDRSQIDRWISRVGLHLLPCDTCGDGRRAGRGSFIIHSSMLVINWLLLEGFSHWNVNEPWHERDELPEVYRKTPEVPDEWAINLPKIPRNCQKLCRIVWVRNIFTNIRPRGSLFFTPARGFPIAPCEAVASAVLGGSLNSVLGGNQHKKENQPKKLGTS